MQVKKRKPVVLECDIENKSLLRIKMARPDSQSWKQNGRGHAARPDRQIILGMGLTCFIEFKRPGEFPTKAQQIELDGLELLGHCVMACDNADHVLSFIDDVERNHVVNWRDRWERNHSE